MGPAGVLPFVLGGATGAGKTAVALELAARLDAEIICADARQVYRGLDVATGKPTMEERSRAPHHAFDILDPRQTTSAGAYARTVGPLAEEIAGRGKTPLFVGGTGLYLRAAHAGLAEVPPIPDELRASVRARLVAEGPAALHLALARVDPALAGRLEVNDGQRISRGLEVALATGRPLSAWQAESINDPPRWFWVALSRPRAEALTGLAARARAFFDAGLVEEVRGLLAAGVPADAPAFDALGYREALDVLSGQLDGEAAIERLTRHTVQYAKRQATWWRGEARRVEVVCREIGPHESPGQVARELAERHAEAVATLAGEARSGNRVSR